MSDRRHRPLRVQRGLRAPSCWPGPRRPAPPLEQANVNGGAHRAGPPDRCDRHPADDHAAARARAHRRALRPADDVRGRRPGQRHDHRAPRTRSAARINRWRRGRGSGRRGDIQGGDLDDEAWMTAVADLMPAAAIDTPYLHTNSVRTVTPSTATAGTGPTAPTSGVDGESGGASADSPAVWDNLELAWLAVASTPTAPPWARRGDAASPRARARAETGAPAARR